MFCAADEAALCEGCDKRVHHANKLASKHLRFTLLHPSCNHAPPLCDVCQERRAFLFCREDRAILCAECDIPIHKANEHTQSHSRFLLTGVKLSSSSSPYPHACPPMSTYSDPNSNRVIPVNVPSYDHDLFSQYSYTSNDDVTNSFTTTTTTTNCNQISEEGLISTSHMLSEYLMKTVPEWRLEDLLDPSFDSHHNLYSWMYEYKSS